jgi:hypothetical protein
MINKIIEVHNDIDYFEIQNIYKNIGYEIIEYNNKNMSKEFMAASLINKNDYIFVNCNKYGSLKIEEIKHKTSSSYYTYLNEAYKNNKIITRYDEPRFLKVGFCILDNATARYHSIKSFKLNNYYDYINHIKIINR